MPGRPLVETGEQRYERNDRAKNISGSRGFVALVLAVAGKSRTHERRRAVQAERRGRVRRGLSQRARGHFVPDGGSAFVCYRSGQSRLRPDQRTELASGGYA